MHDLIIIGGGPAGVSAGIYAARKKMKSAIITDMLSGQSVVSVDIQNWVGTPSISGFDLAQSLEAHLRGQGGIDIMDGERAIKIEKKEDGSFLVTLQSGKTIETKNILLTTGSRHRKLGTPNEERFEGHGLVYCAICDAPLFKGKDVAVVGGGNSGLESVVDLMQYAKKIYLLHHGTALKGDPTTQEKVLNHENVEVIFNAETKEILGEDKLVNGLVYEDLKTGEKKTLSVQGVFVEIGVQPNSELVKDFVNLSEYGHIIVDPRTQKTSAPGIWAAGDVTDCPYRQNNISAGDAIKAVLNIYEDVYVRGKSV
ncbi:MAG: FAD-dependent oxidoreductase [Candidatus Jorgensenbacteria bacterium]|nr:FAD-dependent oxidoreductase [Candidatus Jorgensenbacteria bacterium]